MSTRSSSRLREAQIKAAQQLGTTATNSNNTSGTKGGSTQPSSSTEATSRLRGTRSAPLRSTRRIIKNEDGEPDEETLERLKQEAEEHRKALAAEKRNNANDANSVNNSRKRANGVMASEQIKEEEEVQGLRSLGAGAKKKSRYATKEPVGWEITLDRLREFRLQNPAPVDTMGCERLAEVGETIPPEVSRFQTLVSLLLSSQTKDTVTSVAVRRLQKELKGGLTIQAVLDAPSEKLNSIISAVGFHNKKTIFMKQVAKICRDQYNGDIPDTAEGLTALPGVGPKMAYLTLQVAWNKNLGIGVDTHVHRIANRLGWVKTEKDGPEATREALQSWLPKEHWREINYILVGFGQVLCLPRGPLCPICPVQDRCPSAMMSKKRIKTEVKMQMEEPFGEVEIHAVHTQLERANLQDQNVEEGKVGDGDVQVKEEEDATQVATKSHYFANNGDKQVEIKQEEGITDIMNDDTLAKSTASLIENLHVDGSNLEKESVDIEDLVN